MIERLSSHYQSNITKGGDMTRTDIYTGAVLAYIALGVLGVGAVYGYVYAASLELKDAIKDDQHYSAVIEHPTIGKPLTGQQLQPTVNPQEAR